MAEYTDGQKQTGVPTFDENFKPGTKGRASGLEKQTLNDEKMKEHTGQKSPDGGD